MAAVLSRRAFSGGLAGTGALAGARRSLAQASPFAGKTVKLVVPFPAGGSTDVVARLLSDRLGALWNATIVIENVAGAGANIGNERVAKGPADGSQILMMSTAIAVNQFLYPNLSYDPARDLTPLSQCVSTPTLLCVRKTLPVNSVDELIAYAKANPGKLNYASSGIGTQPHLSGALFNMMAGLDVAHVPYRGAAPSLIDLIGGSVDMMFGTISAIIPHAREGTVKALGISTQKRSPLVPDYPAVAETLPGFDATAWFGVGVRAGTPQVMCDVIERDVRALCREKAVVDHFAALATETIGSGAAEFAAYIDGERAKWGKLVREAKIKGE
jgi:tripartite-type tricarboxylate transporter receptor subunit TctC